MILVTDATIVTETPPLRAAWARIGQQAIVPIIGSHARRVLYGTLNIKSGHICLNRALKWNQDTFQTHLRHIRAVWRGWHIVLFLDRGSPHRATRTRQLARQLGIELRWLPVACPELNPVDHLWRHVKQDVLANEPTPDLDAALDRTCVYILSMTPQDRLRKAGVLSSNFWLRKVL